MLGLKGFLVLVKQKHRSSEARLCEFSSTASETYFLPPRPQEVGHVPLMNSAMIPNPPL